jgi:hypothetical protein
MIESLVQQQLHGYRSGHQLLGGSVKLSREDQDLVDRLSDIAGPLRPGETFEPYLSTYPLPSSRFYVVARTWQDLDAPRAGCVRTRSLLVPMSEWETTRAVAELVALIASPFDSSAAPALEIPALGAQLPQVKDGRVFELVEALFLESRKPVVVFESLEAETIILRVLRALWPGLRRSFATCSWSLAPRKIKGQDFDLLFAPRDARNKFSDWDGRRIEVTARLTEPRHRWSTELVNAIFVNPAPTLSVWDDLGVLETDRLGDGGALRLSLMWRELAGKASTTPNAVLGMLDILNSQSVRPAPARAKLAPLVETAIELAVKQGDAPGTWRFFLNLLGKFSDKLPSAALLRKLRAASASIASEDPASTFELLKELDAQNRSVPAVLAAGIGDGLSKTNKRPEATVAPNALGARSLLQLVAFSRRFSATLCSFVRDQPSEWQAPAVAALELPDTDLIRRARRNVVPHLNDAALAPLILPLLIGATPTELAATVSSVGERTGFEIQEFDKPLIAAARDQDTLLALRGAICARGESHAADRFLFSSLRLDANDVDWLQSNLPRARAQSLLLELLVTSDDFGVQALQRDRATAAKVLDLLLGNPRASADQVARLLLIGKFETAEFIEMGSAIYPYLSGEPKRRLGIELLRRGLGERAATSSIDVRHLIDSAAAFVDGRDLVHFLTQPSAPVSTVAANLEALSAVTPSVRDKVVARVDELTERLISHGTDGFTEATYGRWATLIEAASSVSPPAYLNATIAALSFALKHPRLPLSSLVIISFPPVYKRLLAPSGEKDFEFLPTLLLLPFSFFMDWDRAKTARQELVETFLKSSWPPANLILAARGVGIEQKVLRRLSKLREGNRYITRIWDDSGRLNNDLQRTVRKSINEFSENPNYGEWD